MTSTTREDAAHTADAGQFAHWQRTFWTIASGQTVSIIGSSAVQFALIWWLASETASPLVMGAAGLVAFLPMALLSPVAGVVADRHERKRVCIAADMTNGLLAVLYAVVFLLVQPPVWSVLVILLLRGSISTFQQPAFQAMTPQYVPADGLVRANGWLQVIISASNILGPVAGAALYAAFPLWVVLLSDLVGAVFACSLMAVAHVPPLARPSAPAAAASASPAEPPQAGFLTQLREGVDVYRSDPALLLVLVVSMVCCVFFLPLSSFYPLMTSSYFALDAWHGSVVEMAFAIGMLVAATLFGSVVKVRRHLLVSLEGLLGIGVTCVVCGVIPPTAAGWVVFAVVCGLMGAFGNVNNVPFTAYLQTTVAPERLGRAFSLMTIASAIAMPVGLAVAGPVAQAVGVAAWFLVSGVAMTVASLVGIVWLARIERRHPAGPAPASDAPTPVAPDADRLKDPTRETVR